MTDSHLCQAGLGASFRHGQTPALPQLRELAADQPTQCRRIVSKSKRHKENSPKDDTSLTEPTDREPTHTLPLPLFGEGAVVLPPLSEPPTFGDELYESFVASMIETNAPRRFAVVAHDKTTHNSAVLAWGLDYGDNDVYIDSARDDTRWHLAQPEDVFTYLPEPPEPDCLRRISSRASRPSSGFPRAASN